MIDKARNVSQPKDYKLIVEKDVQIPLRDGAILYADIFRPDGNDVWEMGQQGNDEVPVAKGWLRVSHRKLDPERSLPYRPYHAHDERLWLNPDEIVECHVEIWPTCMVFKRGHRIRLDVQPRDGVGASAYRHYHADYNIGAQNTVYAGGDKTSYLVMPVIPPVTG